ncbi:MAG: isoleucine--tRNA ligase [Erysipelotrichaceae bacterium]
MEYKTTLLMPKTTFEMRGNLPSKEPKFQAKWEAMELYEEMLRVRDGAPTFVLHDGPPYANGNIHIGHALNKILKDTIVRTKFMSGYQTPFIPGWDTHGLPIENAMQKLGHDRKTMEVAKFRDHCYNYALKQVAGQMDGMKALGTVADYKHPYITLQKEYETHQIRIFGKMAMDGLIYQGLKPVYWSPSSESALAEAEIEYHDKKSPAIYVKFDVTKTNDVLQGDESFVIWTTTPWTIPANLAICLNPEFEYAVVECEAGNLIVLKDNVDQLWEEWGYETKRIRTTFKGKELEFVETKHPFYNRASIVILGDHVELGAGTGCVHTAPGHGVDDFMVGMKYGLKPLCPVDEKGYMMEEAGEDLAGLFIDDANKVVGQKLDALGALIKLSFIKHSYPHDWRTKKPIIFRATTQWFASIDKIRQPLLDEIERVDWQPAWGETRLHNMIRDRGDWCISRQRVWGVPIPIFYAEDNTPIMNQEVFDHVADLVKEFGSTVWFERTAKELLPQGFSHPGSPNGEFRKESDTMDVWFDSGSSHTAVLVDRGLPYPADLYFEGSDQYRGWFNSSLIVGTAVHGSAPYKQVLSHGFVVDGKGEKMSKSVGNTVNPQDVMKKYGADILRLWTATIDYQSDVRISDDILKQVSEQYRKVRNTFRFLLANLSDFCDCDLVASELMAPANQILLARLYEVNQSVQKAYHAYDFSGVTTTLTNFMTNDLSAYYLDYTKDILYIEKADADVRREVQSVLFTCLKTLNALWAPILVHTADEVFDTYNETGTIHLQRFVELEKLANHTSLLEDYANLLAMRADVFKALELARSEKVIGKSLEAMVRLHASETNVALLNQYFGDNLAQWLIVSGVELTNDSLPAYEVLEASVTPMQGQVCPRCWNVSQSAHEDHLCDRCATILG